VLVKFCLFLIIGLSVFLLVTPFLAFAAEKTANQPTTSPSPGQPDGKQLQEPTATPLDKMQALQKEVATDDELKEYRAAREEQMALRVSDKARFHLLGWITINGLVLAIASVIGIKSIVDYVKKSATQKIDSVTEERVKQILKEEAKNLVNEQKAYLMEAARKQIAEIMEAQKEELISFARQQIDQISVATRPTKGKRQPAAVTEFTTDSIDYMADMQPVRNQEDEGSNVGFAVAAAVEYQIKKSMGKDVIISPRYLYYFARKDGGLDVKLDSGANIRDAIKVVTTRGAVPEEAWPYRPGEFNSSPPKGIEEAEHYRLTQSFQLTTVDQIKSALLEHGPLVCGVSVYESIYDPKVTQTGVIPDPATKESVIAGLAFCFVGYDDNKKLFKFKHSWGSKWGDHGYGYVSYAYVRKSQGEAWAIAL